MAGFRVRALRRALATSLFVPLTAAALGLMEQAGLDLPERRWVGWVFLALAAVPTTLHLSTAAAGQPWGELERGWNRLETWQRAVSSTVALICGLTTGAAVVLVTLALAEMDAEAVEPPPNVALDAKP